MFYCGPDTASRWYVLFHLIPFPQHRYHCISVQMREENSEFKELAQGHSAREKHLVYLRWKHTWETKRNVLKRETGLGRVLY